MKSVADGDEDSRPEQDDDDGDSNDRGPRPSHNQPDTQPDSPF